MIERLNELFKKENKLDELIKELTKIYEFYLCNLKALSNMLEKENRDYLLPQSLKKIIDKQIENNNLSKAHKIIMESPFAQQQKKKDFLHHFNFIVDDMVTYLYYSLMAIRDNEPKIAFALTRRPFKDNLLLLEKMIDNPYKLMSNIRSEEGLKLLSDEIECRSSSLKNQKIIYKRYEILNHVILSKETNYKLRYSNKKSSLNQVFNRALHLITNYKHWKTQGFDLNLVFLNEKEKEENLLWFLNKICYIMIYSFETVQAVYYKFLGINQDEYLKNRELSIMGFITFAKTIKLINLTGKKLDFNEETLQLQEKTLESTDLKDVVCSKCNKKNQLKDFALQLCHDNFFKCDCGEIKFYDDYITEVISSLKKQYANLL